MMYKKGSGWGIVIVIILIFIGIAILNGGFDSFKKAPLKQGIETGKDIVDITKNVIDKTGEVITVIKEPSNNLGKIPCNGDEECSRIAECQSGNNTLCKCENGYCLTS